MPVAGGSAGSASEAPLDASLPSSSHSKRKPTPEAEGIEDYAAVGSQMFWRQAAFRAGGRSGAGRPHSAPGDDERKTFDLWAEAVRTRGAGGTDGVYDASGEPPKPDAAGASGARQAQLRFGLPSKNLGGSFFGTAGGAASEAATGNRKLLEVRQLQLQAPGFLEELQRSRGYRRVRRLIAQLRTSEAGDGGGADGGLGVDGLGIGGAGGGRFPLAMRSFMFGGSSSLPGSPRQISERELMIGGRPGAATAGRAAGRPAAAADFEDRDEGLRTRRQRLIRLNQLPYYGPWARRERMELAGLLLSRLVGFGVLRRQPVRLLVENPARVPTEPEAVPGGPIEVAPLVEVTGKRVRGSSLVQKSLASSSSPLIVRPGKPNPVFRLDADASQEAPGLTGTQLSLVAVNPPTTQKSLKG